MKEIILSDGMKLINKFLMILSIYIIDITYGISFAD